MHDRPLEATRDARVSRPPWLTAIRQVLDPSCRGLRRPRARLMFGQGLRYVIADWSESGHVPINNPTLESCGMVGVGGSAGAWKWGGM